MKIPTLSIVLPTYNERENISILIPNIFEVLRKAGVDSEVVVVDDSSPDGTAEEVRDLSKSYNCRVIVRNKKEGIGSAHAAGYDEARGNIILTMDADLSHNPEEIPKLLAELEKGTDVVLGSRHLKVSFYERGKLRIAIKNYISNIGNTFIRLLLRVGVHDYSNGFRCFRKEVWESIEVVEQGNAFLMEFAVKAHRNGYKIVEVPTTFRDRRIGESKLNLPKEATRVLLRTIMLSIKSSKRRGR